MKKGLRRAARPRSLEHTVLIINLALSNLDNSEAADGGYLGRKVGGGREEETRVPAEKGFFPPPPPVGKRSAPLPPPWTGSSLDAVGGAAVNFPSVFQSTPDEKTAPASKIWIRKLRSRRTPAWGRDAGDATTSENKKDFC
uniref:Uncharacterized protein n=1 Tax=Sphaerodactylus townsendi TaxID=933632 RepID=A0ACB8E767_9SAUR